MWRSPPIIIAWCLFFFFFFLIVWSRVHTPGSRPFFFRRPLYVRARVPFRRSCLRCGLFSRSPCVVLAYHAYLARGQLSMCAWEKGQLFLQKKRHFFLVVRRRVAKKSTIF
nr:hypothetical protein [Pandoravirus aubagnensis]